METTYQLSEYLTPGGTYRLEAQRYRPGSREAWEELCHKTLKRLGITPNYISYHQLLSAVTLARLQPDSLFSITKNLYAVIAREYGTCWKAVERNISSAAARAWERNPALLQELAGFPLHTRPKASQFIALLADSL